MQQREVTAEPISQGMPPQSQHRHSSYPPVIEASVLPLLPLEKHCCQKRQHSGWKRAPQHLMEHGESVLQSLQKIPKPCFWGSPERGECPDARLRSAACQGPTAVCAALGWAPAERSGGVAHTCQTSRLNTSLAGFSNIATR